VQRVLDGKKSNQDNTAFAPNAPFTFGNAARNLIGGPALYNLDVARGQTSRAGTPRNLELGLKVIF